MRTALLTVAWIWAVAVAAPPEQELPARLDSAVQSAGGKSMWGAVLVARDGRTEFFRGFGEAAPGKGQITQDSLFDIGSASKQFTAAAIHTLRKTGKLSLDDPAAKFFPRLEIPEPAKAITLRHLLGHTSGLTDGRAIQALGFEDRDEAVRRALGSQPNSQPGVKYEYCNAGYIVLAAVVEAASGVPYDRYLREAVLAPAGLAGAGSIDGEGLDEAKLTFRRTRMGGTPREGLLTDRSVEPWAWGLRGAGGVVLSPAMFIAWDRALETDAVLDAQGRRESFTPGLGSYGHGWIIQPTPGGFVKQSHSGRTRGYTSFFARYPVQRVVVVVLSSENTNVVGIAQAVERVLFPIGPMGVKAVLMPGTGAEALKLNDVRVAEIDFGVECNASAVDDTVALTIRADGKEAASLSFKRGEALERATELVNTAHAKLQEAEAAADRPNALVLALKPYAEAPRIALDTGLVSIVMPEYRGIDAAGRRFIDPRTTLVVMDEPNRFWPVILKLGNAEAMRLGGQMREAAMTIPLAE